MAQFDVHRNLGRSKSYYPYFVVLQSGILRQWDRRVVAPMTLSSSPLFDPALMPSFAIEGRRAYLVTQEVGNIPITALGELLTNLEDQSDNIIRALDLVFSRAHPE